MKNRIIYIEAVFVTLSLAFLLKMFVVDAIQVPTASMEPTILPGDVILVNKLSHGTHSSHQTHAGFSLFQFPSLQNIQRGDIVVFKFPDEQNDAAIFVKRCVGIAGDTVLIRNGDLFVNQKFIHTYSKIVCEELKTPESFGPVVIPDNDLFVLGDNLNRSYDSRFWGFVPEENVIGTAELVYWSRNSAMSNHGLLGTVSSIRWNRIGTLLR